MLKQLIALLLTATVAAAQPFPARPGPVIISQPGTGGSSSSGGVDTNAVIALIEQYATGGGVVSNTVVQLTVDTWYTNGEYPLVVEAQVELPNSAALMIFSVKDTNSAVIGYLPGSAAWNEFGNASKYAFATTTATEDNVQSLGGYVPAYAAFRYYASGTTASIYDNAPNGTRLVYFGSGGGTNSSSGSVSAAQVAAIMATNGVALVYNAKGYGAVGNGIADDTLAISNIVKLANWTSAATVGEAYIPKGLYLLSNEILAGGTVGNDSIPGANYFAGYSAITGSRDAILRQTANTNTLRTLNGMRNLTISDLVLLGTNANGAASSGFNNGLVLDGPGGHLTVRDVFAHSFVAGFVLQDITDATLNNIFALSNFVGLATEYKPDAVKIWGRFDRNRYGVMNHWTNATYTTRNTAGQLLVGGTFGGNYVGILVSGGHARIGPTYFEGHTHAAIQIGLNSADTYEATYAVDATAPPVVLIDSLDSNSSSNDIEVYTSSTIRVLHGGRMESMGTPIRLNTASADLSTISGDANLTVIDSSSRTWTVPAGWKYQSGEVVPVMGLSFDGSQITNIARIFNVLDYGATGDGSTDDKAAIQLAVDAAHVVGRGVIYVPSGEYRVSGSVNLTNNIVVRGDGFPVTKIRMTDTAPDNTQIFFIRSSTNVVVENLSLDHNWRNRGLAVNNNENNAISLSYCTNVILRNLRVFDTGKDGVNFDDSCLVSILDSHWDTCRDAGIQSHGTDIIISGNVITNCGWQSASPHPGGISDVSGIRQVIANNVFSSNSFNIFKNGGSSYVISGNVLTSQTNIAASASVCTNVMIQGTSRGIVSGNTFHLGLGIRLFGSGYMISVSENTFESQRGVMIESGEQINISENRFHNTLLVSLPGSSKGVEITGGTAGRVFVCDNRFHMAGTSIYLGPSVSGVKVSGNIVSGTSSSVILTDTSSSSHIIEGNTIDDTGATSINVGYGTNMIIQGNICKQDMVFGGASNNIIRANVFRDISMGSSNCRSNTFENNTVTRNITGTGNYTAQNYWFNNVNIRRAAPSVSGVSLPVDLMPNQIHHTGNVMFGTNALSSWPTAPQVPGDMAFCGSNGTWYALFSTNGTGGGSTSWTATNLFGPK